MLDQQTKGRKASIVNGRKSAVKGQLMTYGRMSRFPETHKSQPDVCKMGESRFFVCGGDESRRPGPGPRERDEATAKGAMCCVRLEERKEKLQFFTPKSNSSRPPNRCADVFIPIPLRCDAKENENAFLMWMMRIFRDSKATFGAHMKPS